MFAVIKTGGKQYVVSKGDVIEIERLKDIPETGEISFDTLLRSHGETVEVGVPVLEKQVKGKFIQEVRGEKKIVFRYHSKTRYRKTKGHRQTFAKIEITAV